MLDIMRKEIIFFFMNIRLLLDIDT